MNPESKLAWLATLEQIVLGEHPPPSQVDINSHQKGSHHTAEKYSTKLPLRDHHTRLISATSPILFTSPLSYSLSFGHKLQFIGYLIANICDMKENHDRTFIIPYIKHYNLEIKLI